jgi:ribosomal protein S18 acetylase RimI-like enzyme
MSTIAYPIRPYRSADLDDFVAVNHAAEQLFAEAGMQLPPDDPAELIQHAHCAFVAGEPLVGFIAVELVDGNLHVAQLSVHPCCHRQGIGGRLLEAAADYASASGLDMMTLTTFRDVQWNAPWYTKRGFAVLPESLWGDGLRSIWVNEVAAGIKIAPRVAMCRVIAGDAQPGGTGPPRDDKDRLRRRQ